jgi:ABC-type nitrate/sulfonate/bicarbonate transport system permease component
VAYSALWGFLANIVAAGACIGFSLHAVRDRSKLRQMYFGMLQAAVAGLLTSALTGTPSGYLLSDHQAIERGIS